MSDTVFVTMYDPNLGNVQVQAPLQAVATYAAHGWLLLDPDATPPPVITPYMTEAAGDSRYVRDWAGAETLTAGAVRMAPDGHVIVRTANGTSRASYDSTEQAAWTSPTGGGGGAVSSVVGLTGTVTGTQIAADPALRAAYGSDKIVGFDTLTHWKAAVAAVRAGTRDGKVLCVGDSTTAGVGLNSAHDQGLPGSYPDLLSAVLRSCDVPAALALGIPQPSGGDARWVYGAGWQPFNGSGFGFGNYSDAQSSAATTATTFTPGVWSDRYDIYFLTNTTGIGSFTASATGGTPVTQPIIASVGIGKVTVSASAAATTNVVSITPAGDGGLHIIGIDPWLSTGRQLRIANAGVGFSTAVQWAAAGNGPQWNAVAAIKAYAPDLTIISLGINDALASATSAAFVSAMNTLITAAQVSGDVLLLIPVPPTAAAAAEVRLGLPVLSTAMRALGVPLADLQRHWGAGEVSQARGIMQDALHPNAIGYAEIGQFLGVPLARAAG